MNLSIIIPTIPERSVCLRRFRKSLRRTAPDAEVIVVRGQTTCGDAWNAGAEQATGRYLFFAADDFEMTEPDWWQEPMRVCDDGQIPAPLIFHPNGDIQSCGGSWQKLERDCAPTEFTRAPFIRREWWPLVGPMPAGMHYFTDVLVSNRARKHGIQTVNCQAFMFTHHLADEGRLDTHERDQDVYRQVAS